LRLKRATIIATDILQSSKMSLKLIAIVITVKILMSVTYVKVVANAVLHPLQLIVKIVVTRLRKRTNNYDVI
jgi:hypothetical protein